MAFDPLEYLPLWQSLVGALGALCVAAFTVWMSNRHTTKRELAQAERTERRERNAQLRQKLEELLDHLEAAVRHTDASTERTLRLLHKIDPVPATFRRDDALMVAEALEKLERSFVLAELYFPSLLPRLIALQPPLVAVQQFNTQQIGVLIEGPTEARHALDETYMTRLREARQPLFDARTALMTEAKAISEKSFEPRGVL